jgi:multidrug efflux pump subunit AcrA (membrane-fusion protein)
MRKLILPLLSAALLAAAVYHTARSSPASSAAAPPAPPARSPFARALSGTGVIEARTENIGLGSALPGLVLEVFVPSDQAGVRVEAGAPLFRVDDRCLRAERKFAAASLEEAEAQLAKLEAGPRPEEVPVSAAKAAAVKAQQAQLQDQFDRARQLLPSRAVSEEDYRQRQLALEEGRQQAARAEAEHALLLAGGPRRGRARPAAGRRLGARQGHRPGGRGEGPGAAGADRNGPGTGRGARPHRRRGAAGERPARRVRGHAGAGAADGAGRPERPARARGRR